MQGQGAANHCRSNLRFVSPATSTRSMATLPEGECTCKVEEHRNIGDPHLGSVSPATSASLMAALPAAELSWFPCKVREQRRICHSDLNFVSPAPPARSIPALPKGECTDKFEEQRTLEILTRDSSARRCRPGRWPRRRPPSPAGPATARSACRALAPPPAPRGT